MNELITLTVTAAVFAGWVVGITAGMFRLAGPRRERVNLSRFYNGYFAQKQYFGKLK